MKLSTKGQYGVLAMCELAAHYGDGPMSVKEIAERQNISDAYLEQLFSSLKKAGLITSLRGAHGGYKLSRQPNEIAVGEVIDAVEGPIEFCGCSGSEVSVHCGREMACPTAALWGDVLNSIRNVVDHRSLQDLIVSHPKTTKENE
ncbi:RrF2 family transcriptional regulator [Pseudoramibacter porci]|uniref:Rrf2 family transcriptional regulator n=1 Tax=Pseudoramibacter porci TaxID=2606631 RepID=A0A7X2TB98_9FIRM|nr:Rrf2 family transcriptional regulator [Pseudoramibacter porci]MSS20321.1 Rrf2 family transcriptional regulator [Pseudoramibacter porci]